MWPVNILKKAFNTISHQKIQMKITLGHHLACPSGRATIKETNDNKCYEDVGKGDVNCCSHYGH